MANRKKRPNLSRTRRGGKTATAKLAAGSANDRILRQHLVKLLNAGTAHLNFDKVIGGWPEAHRGVKPSGAPHTAWQLLEHLRIAQWDILKFIRDPKHVSPGWPTGYWPATDAPPNKGAWEESIRRYRADCEALQRLVASPKTELYARIPHGTGQTILREALLVADHTAYHLGQLVLVRRLLGAWPGA
jgi:hypothetical protein